MAQIDNIILTATKRFWFGPALTGLCVTCALLDMVGLARAAEWFGDKGSSLLARYGVVVGVKPTRQ